MNIFLFLLLALITPVQNKEYVCLPCGRECDKDVYDHLGTCQHCGMALVEKSNVKFKESTFQEVCSRLKANPKAVLIDVRTPEEFKGTSEVPSFGHFNKAININVDELPNRLKELSKYKNQEVIVYCSHSHRSPRASYTLTSNGFTNVTNVEGGVSTISESDKECLKANFVSHSN